jgi:hypothetical protein
VRRLAALLLWRRRRATLLSLLVGVPELAAPRRRPLQ